MTEEKLLARKAELEKELQIGIEKIQETTIIVQQIRGAIMLVDEFLKLEGKKDLHE